MVQREGPKNVQVVGGSPLASSILPSGVESKAQEKARRAHKQKQIATAHQTARAHSRRMATALPSYQK